MPLGQTKECEGSFKDFLDFKFCLITHFYLGYTACNPIPQQCGRSNNPKSDTPSPSRIVSILCLWFRGEQGAVACGDPPSLVLPPSPFPWRGEPIMSLPRDRPNSTLAGPRFVPQPSVCNNSELKLQPQSSLP